MQQISQLQAWKERSSAQLAELQRTVNDGLSEHCGELERQHHQQIMALDTAHSEMEEIHAQQVTSLRKKIRSQAKQVLLC